MIKVSNGVVFTTDAEKYRLRRKKFDNDIFFVRAMMLPLETAADFEEVEDWPKIEEEEF